MLKQIIILFFFILFCDFAWAQIQESIISDFKDFPIGYLKNINKKIIKHTHRISSKTEKTLTKLSHWENKIKALLNRTSPETAEQLFGKNQITFTSLLQQLKNGEAIALQYQATYNKYRDDVTTSLQYLSQQNENLDSGIIKKAVAVSSKMKQLNSDEDNCEAIQQFIKQRKKELIEHAFQQLKNNKFLIKINKEAYYYAETLKNYKELFGDSKKAEKTGKEILNKIPAFQKFMQQNSQLASLFGQPGEITALPNIIGLQTSASVQNLIQERMLSSGPNAQQAIMQNVQEAQLNLNSLKDKLLNATPGNELSNELPDFKPNMQKTKTLKQRIEFGSNLQFSKTNSLIPSTTDIGVSLGYKINDKSILGVGGSYKLGIGSVNNIRFSNQGVSLRSFTDWQLKRQFYISGGFEMNYLSNLQSASILPLQQWQQSGLLGLSKKIAIKTKLFKETKLQFLYDFLSQQHVPVSQPILLRVGYNF